MLVLTRKYGQSILIGDNIVVTVLYRRGDKVRLGIEAPREIPVVRDDALNPYPPPPPAPEAP